MLKKLKSNKAIFVLIIFFIALILTIVLLVSGACITKESIHYLGPINALTGHVNILSHSMLTLGKSLSYAGLAASVLTILSMITGVILLFFDK